MGIEIRLKGFLKHHNLDSHGILKKIVDGTHHQVSRPTVSKLYSGGHIDCSLQTLSALCESLACLLNLGPNEVLKELLGTTPASLWSAVAKSACARICLGERRDTDACGQVTPLISRRDASVCTQIVSHLSRATPLPKITVEYAPASLYSPTSVSGRDSTAEAIRLFGRLRAERRDTSTILIGSQRANDLVELFVADLFGLVPFRADPTQSAVPFYLTFRKGASKESCFGGAGAVPGSKSPPVPGIAYVDERGQWRMCPWGPGDEDSGVVVVVRDSAINSLEIACLGLSGWATEALGGALIADGDAFCQNTVGTRGKVVSVCVCKFRTAESSEPGGCVRATNLERVFLSAGVLNQYLPQPPTRSRTKRRLAP